MDLWSSVDHSASIWGSAARPTAPVEEKNRFPRLYCAFHSRRTSADVNVSRSEGGEEEKRQKKASHYLTNNILAISNFTPRISERCRLLPNDSAISVTAST